VKSIHKCHSHHEIFPVGNDSFEQSIMIRRAVPVQENLSRLVHNTDEHRSCVKVDTAIELMRLCVESHKASSLDIVFRLR
jgi:hypothetical protein